jgi:hypothetical protein
LAGTAIVGKLMEGACWSSTSRLYSQPLSTEMSGTPWACYASAIERKEIVRDGNPVDRRDAYQQCSGGEGKPGTDSILVEADEAEQGDDQQW